jgi:hypothetical protein
VAGPRSTDPAAQCSERQGYLRVAGGLFDPAQSYNQNLWMHHLTEGATYLPL